MTNSQELYPSAHSPEYAVQIEQAIESVVAECDASAIFGTLDERRDYAIRVIELKSAIESDGRIGSLDTENYINNLDKGVAKKIGVLANDLIEKDQVSDETLDALTALPVPAPAFQPVIDDLYSKAIDAHETLLKATSLDERNAHLKTADEITAVAVRLARDIPEIRNGRAVIAQGGRDVHKHQLNAIVEQAKKDSSRKQAVNSFLKMGNASYVPDKNPVIQTLGRTVAIAGITSITLGATSVGAAHANVKIEKIETKESLKTIKDTKEKVILPAAAPAPDKEPINDTKSNTVTEIPPTATVSPKTEVPKIEDEKSTVSEVKTDTLKSSGIAMDLPKSESKPTDPALDEKGKTDPSPASTQKESDTDNTKSSETSNTTGNKSTSEKTDSKNTSEPTENKAEDDTQPPKASQESDVIKIDIPDSENETESTNENPASGEDKQGKEEDKEKILDHLKKDDTIAMSLDDVKKMTENRKDDDEPKDDSDKKGDEAKVETIAQQDTQPSQKEKFNKEITKFLGGNGPIAMSLDDVKKMTKERKDDDKSHFKPSFTFAPSAELPAEPKITAETYKGAPIPEVIVDPGLASETAWTPEQLTIIRDNLDSYLAVAKRTGMPWELGVALHARETSLRFVNPANGQGLFQLYSSGAYFAPGPVSKENFETQLALGMNFIKKKGYELGYTDAQMTLEHPDVIKDILFSYNGRAWQYKDQAASLGFTNPAEGSPYVMNLADDKRNNLKNPSWGQILRDNDKNLGPANQVPGAWVLIEGMMHIEKKAHDQAVAKQQAEAQEFEAKKAAEAKAAADAEAAKKAQTVGNGEVEPFNGWHRPVPANSAVSPQYPGHKGIDFAVKSGTPFYAAAGGVAKVIIYDDVRDDEFCIAAFDKLGRKTSEIKDPVQKEVRITRMIGNDEYVLIYAHMSQIDVKDGDIVTAGQEIGKTGNSGCSTGDHAHFEVRKNGVAIDPNLVLNGAINVSSSEINVIDDGHGHSDHEHGSGATDPSVEVPVAVNQPAGDGLLKIDHTAETAKNPDVAVTSDTGDAIEGVSVQDHVDPAIEAVVSQAIEKARLAAEIFNAALDRARSNDSQLVK